MDHLKIIDEREVLGKQFRIYGTFKNPLFLAKEVAEWIDYSKREDGSYQVGQMLRSIESDEKISTVNNLNGKEMWFLTEDGLYEVLMQSRKPIAKQFKKKVKEILKDIRKHGMYATDELLNNPDMAIKAFTALKEEREKNKKLQIENKRMRPKEIFADAVAASHTTILIGDLAKLLKQNGVETGQKRLFEWLRENGYLIKRKGTDWNMPTQKSMELGLFEVKESAINNPDGSVRINKTTKVTGKGQQYFINKFLKQPA